MSLTAAALADRGHEVVILTGESAGVNQKDLFQNGSILRIPDREIIHPFRYTRLFRSIEPLHCDVLVNYLSFMLLPKFTKLLEKLRIPAVHRMIHGKILFADAKHALGDLFLRYPLAYGKMDFYDIARLTYPACLLRNMARTVGTIITLSKKSQAWFHSAGFEDVDVIPPPVEPAWFESRHKPESVKNVSKKLLYYGGGPSLFRGIDTLVSALSTLNDHNIMLEICLRRSDMRDAEFLTTLIDRHGLSSQVRLVCGFQDVSYLLDSVARSDCMVFPFKLMAKVADIPVTILESMACGKPIVSTMIGAIPEVIDQGRTGLLVEPSNSAELSQAIHSIMQNDSLRESLALRAKKSAEQYEAAVVMKKLVELYVHA